MDEPVSLSDIRQHLRLDPDDDSENFLLTSLITAARRACENYLNRSVVGATRTAVFSGFPRYPNAVTGIVPDRRQLAMYLSGGRVASIQSVTYFDGDGIQQTINPTSYALDAAVTPALLSPIDVWPVAFNRLDAVSVAYTVAALDDADMEVVSQAMRLLIGNWYSNREGVAFDFRGTPMEMPLTVTFLLQPLRVIPFR